MKRLPLFCALALTIAFAVYFSAFDIVRHQKTNSTRFDLGNMEQTLWNVTHGHGFTLTDPYGTTNVSRLAFHADLFLLALAPFYALFSKTETLLILQAFVAASGVLAIFFIARRWLKNPWWGVLFGFAYVLDPGLQWSVIFDVHAVVFATALVLWAVWAAIKKRYWLALLFVVFAMTTKEETGLALGLLGLVILRRQHERRWGIVLLSLPILWSLAMFLLILPHFRLATPNSELVYQSVFGTGALSIIRGSLAHPLTFIHAMVSKQNLLMVLQNTAPFGLLSFGSVWSLGATPDYVINALSLKPAQHLIISHYTAGLLPWLVIGAMATGRRLIKRFAKLRYFGPSLAMWLALASVVSTWAFGPLPGARHDWSAIVRWQNDYAQPIADWEKRIPNAARVSATNDIGAHFARRQYLYSFPVGVEQSDYLVVLQHHARPVVATEEEVGAKVEELRHNPHWKIVYHQNDLTIFQRRS